uniref:C-type lectin domain-containing protein n=1 Tax=Gadus morhua TaxID=8049 RepID=A0A8C5BUX5_GADMO
TGPSGIQGKPEQRMRGCVLNPSGTTCDCGRYRKVVGQLDINIGRLQNALKFIKNGILKVQETAERYYLLVTESRAFEEALVSCRLRGGALAMPKTRDANRLLADYVSGSGLTAVFIGLNEWERMFKEVTLSPLGGFAAWGPGQGPPSGTNNSSCVELLNTGSWGPAACHLTMFYICEFPKTRRRVGAAG